MQIGDQDIYMSNIKPWKKNPKIKSIAIMSMKTKKALDSGKDVTHADPMDYQEVKNMIEAHKDTIFKNATKFQINVLTPVGWRSGNRFSNKNEIDWVDWATYNDRDDDIEEIYAIEILYW